VNTDYLGSEKAGVGGSIPSLANHFYNQQLTSAFESARKLEAGDATLMGCSN
jgi:hypothetical protein